jgi:hypothetical protein
MTTLRKRRRYTEAELPKPYETVLDGYRVRVSFIAPVTKEAKAKCEQARAYNEYAAAQCPPDPPVTMVGKYRVRVHYVPCPPEEAKSRREALARIIAQSIMERGAAVPERKDKK